MPAVRCRVRRFPASVFVRMLPFLFSYLLLLPSFFPLCRDLLCCCLLFCCGPLFSPCRCYRTPSRHAVLNQRKLACSAASTLLAMVSLVRSICRRRHSPGFRSGRLVHRRRRTCSGPSSVDATLLGFAQTDQQPSTKASLLRSPSVDATPTSFAREA